MKGYKFKIEFIVWGRKSKNEAEKELENYLLESEEGFNIKKPEFIGEEADPIEKLREEEKKCLKQK